jgi:hypothetical protein
MSYSCPSCQSNRLIKRGTYFNKTLGLNKQRYSCNECSFIFSVDVTTEVEKSVSNKKKYLITSCQNDTSINIDFYNTLLSYCEVNNAELIIMKTKYKVESAGDESYYVDSQYLLNHNMIVANNIKIFGGLNLMPTLVSPLSGLDSLSAGYTCIFGHNSVQLKTLPVNADQHPIIMTTTGSVSVPNNSDTKTGQKADYNHSYSAIVLELDDKDAFHMRLVTADETGGFYDLTTYYHNDTTTSSGHRIDAIILGDVHVDVADKNVIKATYSNVDSIVNTLKPKQVVMHDLLDFNQLQSHHNKNNYLKRFQKYIKGEDDIQAELDRTVQFVVDNTPDFVEQNLIVSSNHIDHLEKFLNTGDIKSDYKNSLIYHYLMYKVLRAIKNGEDVNAFQVYFEEFCEDDDVLSKTRFLGREDSYFIQDILVSSHGDVGLGGSRFSPTQGRKFPHKMVTGHSHQIAIEQQLYVAGTCTGKLDYASGAPSSWINGHVIIYPNGTRTHINIIKGKWKA